MIDKGNRFPSAAAVRPSIAISPPDDRVRHHFAALADAMNEITRETSHGWFIQAGERNGWMRQVTAQRWFNAKAIMLQRCVDLPRSPDFMVEAQDRDLLGDLAYFDAPSDCPFIAPIGICEPRR